MLFIASALNVVPGGGPKPRPEQSSSEVQWFVKKVDWDRSQGVWVCNTVRDAGIAMVRRAGGYLGAAPPQFG